MVNYGKDKGKKHQTHQKEQKKNILKNTQLTSKNYNQKRKTP
jgi:hypothetical protein